MKQNWRVGLPLIIFSTFIVSSSSEEYPRVTTPLGKIKGFYQFSSKNLQYEAYEGIPYAMPPTGPRRFEPPAAVEAWSNELDATKEPNGCLQFHQQLSMILGDEDCLYLNVYVPSSRNATSLPVVVWFHGGGFQYGNPIHYRPTHIMNKNVIFISIGYRMGPFGFLSTNNELVPGNMGLKDQTMALQWISKYIEYFGGDRKRVTLTGCSAGGSSVHYHYLSPMSVGLFQNGISASGTALSPWAYTDDPMRETTLLANLVNCTTEDLNELLRCLKQKPALEIADAIKQILLRQYLNVGVIQGVFLPVAEKIKTNYFINRSPSDIIKSGDVYDVPWVAGAASAEGLYFTEDIKKNQTRLSYIDKHWNDVAPYMLMLRSKMPENKFALASYLGRKHYLSDKSFAVNDEVAQGLIDLVGDIDVLLDNQEAIKLHAAASRSSVHFYYNDYRTNRSNIYGAPHCDDCNFILKNDDFDFTANPDNTLMLEKSLNFIYSLATRNYSSWINTWHQVNAKTDFVQYIHIKSPNDIINVSDDDFAQRKFWMRVKSLVQE